MTLAEKETMMLNAIRMLKDKLCELKYTEYDGILSTEERNLRIDQLQKHLHSAISVLIEIRELMREDDEVAS